MKPYRLDLLGLLVLALLIAAILFASGRPCDRLARLLMMDRFVLAGCAP